MDGQMMPTGSLPAVRNALGLQTFPPEVSAVRQARRFVESAVAASGIAGVESLADDAGLLVSELAANAVLHARSDFDIAVYEVHDGVRVSVRDRSQALPVLVAPSSTAMSGRGLALVQTLAAAWGAGASTADGAVKSVWFELVVDRRSAEPATAAGPGRDAGPAGPELSVDELLAAWEEDAGSEPQPMSVPPAGGAERAPSVLEAVLPPLDAARLAAAKEAMDDVLRELQMVLLDEDHLASATPAELDVARSLDGAAREFDDVRRQVRLQVSRAAATGQVEVALELALSAGTAARALAYRSAVRAAEELATGGMLLSTGEALRAHRAVREAYLGEVIAAAQQ